MVFAMPTANATVLCIGDDGHMAIEALCLAEDAEHGHHPYGHGERTAMASEVLGHHVDSHHDGTCHDYRISNNDRIESRFGRHLLSTIFVVEARRSAPSLFVQRVSSTATVRDTAQSDVLSQRRTVVIQC